MQLSPGCSFAAFSAIRDRDLTAPSNSFSSEQAMAVIDEVIGFVRGGLEALRRD
jgi:hypothetical protein